MKIYFAKIYRSQFVLRCCSSVFLLVISAHALAAFCSLRDPVSAIQKLFPSASHHRSIVRNVSLESREEVVSKLPFDLHYNEIGRHTAYVVFKDIIPVGVVHARSESSKWGLIEIAWALNMELRITDFHFQRCRIPACNENLKKTILSDIKGLTLDSLLELFDSKGVLDSSLQNKYGREAKIAQSIISSAAKTMQLTQSEWGDALSVLATDSKAQLAKKYLSLSGEVYVERASKSKLETFSETYYQMVSPQTITVFDVLVEGTVRAKFVEGRWMYDGETGAFLWLFKPDGEVVYVAMLDEMADPEMTNAFNNLVGKNVSKDTDCNTPAELTARDMFVNAY